MTGREKDEPGRAKVSTIGTVGDNEVADVTLSVLRRKQVDLRDVQAVRALTGQAVIAVDSTGENTTVVAPGTNTMVDEGFVDQVLDSREAAVVVTQGEIPGRSFDAIAHRAHSRFALKLAQ